MSYYPPQPQYPTQQEVYSPQWQPPSQPLPPQQQPPLANPPNQKRPKKPWKPWQLVLLGMVVGMFIGYAIHMPPSSQSASTPSTSVTANTSSQQTQPANQPTSQPTQPPVTPTPTHIPKWTATQTFSGNGAKKTATFTAPDDWKIVWTCDPSSFYGGQYNLIVGVNNSDGSSLDPAAVNTICKAGNTHDETEERQSGQVYLDVNSEGAWTIQIQELK